MTSRNYSNALRGIADWLDSKPEFALPTEARTIYAFWHYRNEKDNFLAGVRALGAGSKEFTRDEVKFVPNTPPDVHIQLDINRNVVCRLVQEAVWDCDPLLSKAEEAEVGTV